MQSDRLPSLPAKGYPEDEGPLVVSRDPGNVQSGNTSCTAHVEHIALGMKTAELRLSRKS